MSSYSLAHRDGGSRLLPAISATKDSIVNERPVRELRPGFRCPSVACICCTHTHTLLQRKRPNLQRTVQRIAGSRGWQVNRWTCRPQVITHRACIWWTQGRRPLPRIHWAAARGNGRLFVAARDGQRLAGYPAGISAGQERDCGGDVLWLANSSERRRCLDLLPHVTLGNTG